MTIEELQNKLDYWRKNKKSKLERIPPEFWDEVIKLAKESNPATVAEKHFRTCSISGRKLTPLFQKSRKHCWKIISSSG